MRNGIGHGNKPYYQFVRKSDDIPTLYNKKALIKYKKPEKSSFTKRDFNDEAQKIIHMILSDKKNIKLISSIVCYLFITIDKKHHHVIKNIEMYLETHNKISIPSSSEIPVIFDKVINVVLNNAKANISKEFNIQKEIEHILHILLTECIYHTKDLHIHRSSFKHRYPNILRLLKDTIVPLLQKHQILFKILQMLNETCGEKVMVYFPNSNNRNAIEYFIKLRNMVYDDEECKKAIGYNLYVFFSKKTNKLSQVRYINELLTKNKTDIHKILKCISENPNFTKRLLKNALHKISNNNEQQSVASKLENFITKSTIQTKNIARKCRTMANNVFVLAKMGTSLYTVGKKLENKFPGIAKSLFF